MAYRVQKWGNSNGVRIPKVYLEALHIKSGDPINIVRDENKIIITKAEREKASLKPLCAAYSSKMVTVRLPLRHRIWH